MRARKTILYATIACVIAYAPLVAIYGSCISGLGGWEIPGVELFVLIPPVMAILVGLVALPFLFRAVTRADATSVLIVAAAIVLSIVPAMIVGSALRMFGFRLASQRAEPIIGAVERFVQDHGVPPEKLQDLVPGYLPSLPSGIPELRIVTSAYGNQWALLAPAGTGFFNWDEFIYLPNQDYSQAGNLKRIEKWAYVYE